MAQLHVPNPVSLGIPSRVKVYRFKLVIVGEEAVGKTSLAVRFIQDEFREDVNRTLGACFLTRTIELDEARVTFHIWDTAGQEKYRSLAPMYYRGAEAAMVVYDITSKSSFLDAKTWVDRVKEEANAKLVIAIAGNKVDLDIFREVEYEEGASFAEKNDILFMETSAVTGSNVKDIFFAIAEKLPNMENVQLRAHPSSPLSLSLSDNEQTVTLERRPAKRRGRRSNCGGC